MPDGFKNLPLQVTTSDGHNFAMLTPPVWEWRGKLYRGIIGGTTDGASTPQAGWAILPPFGWYWPDAVAHDLVYRCMAEVQNEDASWTRIQMQFAVANQMLYDLMTAHQPDGIGVEAEKLAIYEAVKNAGQNAFLGDLAQPITI